MLVEYTQVVKINSIKLIICMLQFSGSDDFFLFRFYAVNIFMPHFFANIPALEKKREDSAVSG